MVEFATLIFIPHNTDAHGRAPRTMVPEFGFRISFFDGKSGVHQRIVEYMVVCHF